MKDSLLLEVIDFFGGKSCHPMDENTEINNDLELMGDDAYFMLLHFGEKFNVKFGGINFNEYFAPELHLKYWYYKYFKPEELKRKPLKISHMVEVAKRGYWFEPVG
jgi:hypothetical protein